MAVRIPNATALLACDAIVDDVDAGASAGTLEIRTGAAPTNCEDVDSGTLLGTLTFSDPAFGSAVDNAPGAIATAAAITSDTNADATGTAAHFRVKDSNGVVRMQGTVGTSGADLNLDNVSIVAGGTIAVTSMTFELEET